MMSDCHDLFQKFYENIKLTESKKESLRSARDAIRDRINNYFKDTLKKNIPEFRSQGSFSTSTIINPLDGEFDIDDGVYLKSLDSDKSKWPSPETVHKWIYEAVKEHTKEIPIDKTTCIRVKYSGKYHVDLPIYGEYKHNSYLAEKGKQDWPKSDPIALKNWFLNKVKDKEQLRRIVCYLKAWSGYNSKNKSLPSGLILTILVVENFLKKERDDSSFGGTIKNINNEIVDSFVVKNPVDTQEILSDRLTPSQKKNFKDLLYTLLKNASRALKEVKKKSACEIWRKEFGDRFPSCDELSDEKDLLFTTSPALLKDDARSA